MPYRTIRHRIRRILRRQRKNIASRRVRKPFTTRRSYRPRYERNTAFVHPPERLKTRVSSVMNLAVAPGATSYHITLAVGSCTDPFGGYGTSQPFGWDMLCNQYVNYIVDSGIMKFVFNNETTNTVAVLSWVDTTSADFSGTYPEATNKPRCKQQIVGASGSSKTAGWFRVPFSTKSICFGSLDDQDKWAPTSETGSGNFSTPMYLHIAMYSHKSSSSANITGMLNFKLYQNIRLHSMQPIAEDTTAN